MSAEKEDALGGGFDEDRGKKRVLEDGEESGAKRVLEEGEERVTLEPFKWYCFATVSMKPFQGGGAKERIFYTGLCTNDADLLESGKKNARDWIDANRNKFNSDWFMLSTNFNTMNDIMSAFGRYARENASDCIFALVWATGRDLNMDGLDTNSFLGLKLDQNQ